MEEWGKNMVKDHGLHPDGRKYVGKWKNGEIYMVKEHSLTLMEESMWGNSRMENMMVKEHTLGLMEESM